MSEPSIPQRTSPSLSSEVVEGRSSTSPIPSSSVNNRPERNYSAGVKNSARSPDASQKRRPSRVSFNTRNEDSSRRPRRPSDDDDNDDDDDDEEESYFEDKNVRLAFIRKVYLLIMVMMLCATGIISFMLFHVPTRRYVLLNPWVVIVSWISYPVLLLILICFVQARRTVPCNYIVLFLVTLALSVLAGCSAARFNKIEVLAAFAITTGVCLALTIFACQTKWDFTVMSGGLVVASLIMLVFAIVCLIWRNKIMMMVYSCLGALLGCMFFIFDTQIIMGGKHKYAINPEEYVFAAVSLFTDMINIFILILNIIGLARNW